MIHADSSIQGPAATDASTSQPTRMTSKHTSSVAIPELFSPRGLVGFGRKTGAPKVRIAGSATEDPSYLDPPLHHWEGVKAKAGAETERDADSWPEASATFPTAEKNKAEVSLTVEATPRVARRTGNAGIRPTAAGKYAYSNMTHQRVLETEGRPVCPMYAMAT